MAHSELEQIVAQLIDAWCDRRALGPLRIVLPAWPLGMGLTDDWHRAREAFRHIRAMEKDALTPTERDQLNRAIVIVDQAIFGEKNGS